jgi:acetylornithine deacetylase/succinyl-diaminopimelate desuccinylase-like protein
MRYLETEMRERFEAMGFAVDIHPNDMLDRAPFLVAKRIEDPSLPTLFCYGHGDTVPGEEGRWSEDRDPWTLDVAQTPSGPRWYGRGTADNKAQHAINMEAMRHVIETRGRLGYNATFLIEMAEEMGSPGLYEFCRDNRDMLAADLLIASDGPRFSTDAPDIKLGTRGGLNLRFRLEYRERWPPFRQLGRTPCQSGHRAHACAHDPGQPNRRDPSSRPETCPYQEFRARRACQGDGYIRAG